MAIDRIIIKNYKSIENCSLSVNDINSLIGENGTGKSNILSAVNYFYRNLIYSNPENDVFDRNNRFSNQMEISLVYDMRKLKRIAMHNYSVQEDTQYKRYYEHIRSMRDFIALTLVQTKNDEIRWSHKFNIRQTFFYLFPLYYIDSRNIELTDWHNLWQHIGDLIKLESSLAEDLKKEITLKIQDEKYSLNEKFNKIKNALDKANIGIQPFSPKDFAATLSMLNLYGKTFNFHENELVYFSNGTNAFNYTNILLNILKLISECKIKEPFVIIDEPEISLHHKLIDELTDNFFSCSDKLTIILSTHSPRLLKNILKNGGRNCNIYHVTMKDNYSLVSKVCLFSSKEKQSRVVITDQHSNAYFAKKILSVEGETELELFDNAYLTTLFPHLKQVEIICGMSNYVVQKIISPSLRRYQTPIVSVIDMDKVITKLPGKNCFVPVKNSPIKPDDKKNENYLYSYKRRDTLHIRNRILKMLNWCRFHYILPFFSCTDDNFKELIELIQKYLLQYNLFAVSTTIEGALITPSNYEGFWEYLKERFSQNKDWQRFEDLYNSLEEQERVNAMRLLCNGKSDYIMSLKEVKRDNPKLSSTTDEAISKNKIEKTSGWVSEWLEFYICKKLGLTPFTENAYNEFKRAMLVTRNKEMLEKYFRTDFEELYRLIEMIKNA